MSAAPGQVAQVACPSCQTLMRVAIVNIIDAEAQPHLKSQLLGGRLNASNCTKCGSPVILAAPLIYHDGSKQFCFVHIPQQLLASAKGVELERFVGSATNLLMNELPPDAPKGYLLAPKRFLTMQTLVEAVFEGDGVSKNARIAAQTGRYHEPTARCDESRRSGPQHGAPSQPSRH